MLITFRSRAAGDVIMFGDVGRRMLEIMGKDPADRQGIVTVEQLPAAIARLRAAMEEDRAAHTALVQAEDDEEGGRSMMAPVSLIQRAVPLVELLEYARRDGEPMIWEATGR
ncbi:MAG: DUF1840 domain-containing protein [Betaproteobacteria bacterium]|nr:DUF1840 domain-containing protein [Betaproteobacteria bacterium]